MKRFLLLALTASLLFSVEVEAHHLSYEERAVDLVVEKYDKQLKERLEGTVVIPSYVIFREDECNVRVKSGTHQLETFSAMEWFDVDVCKGQIKLIDITKR